LRALFARKDAVTEWVDLNLAVDEVAALLQEELRRSQVILEKDFADLPLVNGDRVQLQQVIVNLFKNAADAMKDVDDRPRHLLVATAPDEGDRVRLTVSDAGPGIAPEASERIFDAFYTTKVDGMGIGLSVSRSIIESHHGRLWAQPNDGPGATFAFSIPCRSEPVSDPVAFGAIRAPSVPDAQSASRQRVESPVSADHA